MPQELLCREGELQVLLNLLGDCFDVTYPLTNLPVANARSSGDNYVVEIAGRREFDRVPHDLGILNNEMPAYNDVMECFVSSGTLGFSNMEEVKKQLGNYGGLKRRACYCPDTNILYRRFISNSGLVKADEAVIVSTVRDEIESQMNFKYTPEQITIMKTAMPYSRQLIDEMVNKRMKKSRKAAYFAARELRYLREGGALEVEAAGEGSKDKEMNDALIARTLKRLERDRGRMPVMLTADNSMTDLCRTENIEYILFKMPFEAQLVDAPSGKLVLLISSLAGMLGVVKINSVLAFSEYKGKQDMGEMKLVFLDQKIGEKFQREVGICRRLMGLGIQS
jgi:hypothetical protein